MRKLIDFITLGCSKNLVDSEWLMGLFEQRGFHCTHDAKRPQADIVVINTCGFIEDAKQESIDTILAFAQRKDEGRIRLLYVMGCLSQRYRKELAREIPQVDGWYGKFDFRQLLVDLEAASPSEGEAPSTAPSLPPPEGGGVATALLVWSPPPSGGGREGASGASPSVIVLGSGAYRIGSSVEFDWCGVQALDTIRREGYRSVMINYNPETVSTDYDMCDRLYFDELTFERVMDIIDVEQPHGVIVSTGGQIPNNLAMRLDQQHVPILGTSAKDIDGAEDRAKFSAMLTRNHINQPQWSALTSMHDIDQFVGRVGFPVLVRPSYVLSGAAMNVCSNKEELQRFLQLAANVSEDHPVVVSKFIENAKEIEMDAVARNGEILAYAISEHIEFAGVHSGDATIQFPPQKIYVETVRRIKRVSRQIAAALHINGPFNIQFMARENDILVIECNLRASRSFPFVSKVLKLNLIDLATKVMLGLPVEKPAKNLFDLDYVGIKASQFSFNRLQKADPVLGVDMASTGEVGCLGDDTHAALLKAMLSVGHRIPRKTVLLSTGGAKQKAEMLDAARKLVEHGYQLYATGGTSDYLTHNAIANTRVYWPSDHDSHPQALHLLHQRKIDMVVNIPKDLTPRELTNGYKIRRAAVDLNIPLITNSRLASAFINAFCSVDIHDIDVKSWAEY